MLVELFTCDDLAFRNHDHALKKRAEVKGVTPALSAEEQTGTASCSYKELPER